MHMKHRPLFPKLRNPLIAALALTAMAPAIAQAQLTCEAGAIDGQAPASPFTGVVSDWGPPNHPIDQFTSTGTIGDISVWGYFLDDMGAPAPSPVGGGEQWGLDIYLYEDNGGVPADGGGFLGRLTKLEFASDANGDSTSITVEDTGEVSTEGANIFKITTSGIAEQEIPTGTMWIGFFRWGPNVFHVVSTSSGGDNSFLDGDDPLTNTSATGDLAFCVLASAGGEGEGEGEQPAIIPSTAFPVEGNFFSLTAPAGGTGYSWEKNGGAIPTTVSVFCSYEGNTECGVPSFDNDATDGGFVTDTPAAGSTTAKRIVIDPLASVESRGDYFIGGLGSLDLPAFGFINFYTKWTGALTFFRLEIFDPQFDGAERNLLTEGDLPLEGEWGYVSFSLSDLSVFGDFDPTDITSMSFRIDATDGMPPVEVLFDHFTLSQTPESGQIGENPRISGVNSNVLAFNPVVLSDSGTYTVDFDDGSKAPVSLSFLLNVVPAGSVPAVGIVGVAVLGAASMLAGAWAARRKKD